MIAANEQLEAMGEGTKPVNVPAKRSHSIATSQITRMNQNVTERH